jgi:hypothetical protein
MANRASTNSRESAGVNQTLNRRRALHVLGALAAAAAGAGALDAVRPEGAEAYVQTEPSTQFTGPIASTGGNGTTPLGATIVGTNPNNGYAIYGETNAGGITSAIYGHSTGTDGTGIYGLCDTDTGSKGVFGQSDTGSGVIGIGALYGVWGQAESPGGLGVYGINLGGGTAVSGDATGGSGGAGGIGVQGTTRTTGGSSNAAVVGTNTGGGPGLLGQSTSGIGIWGVTTTSGQGLANPAVAGSNDGGGAGLVGFTTGPSSIGLGGATDVGIGAYGSSQTGIGLFGYSNTGIAINGNSPGGGYAGYFSGPVFVTGSLTAMGAKSAAVKTKGGLSRVYSMESPESWFEDFGTSKLTAGQATVSLEPGFADIVHTDTYHLFITPKGDCKGLYVSSQSGGGFSVRELQGGSSNVAFDYRIVAKRADIAGARLEHVDEPHPQDGPKEPVLDHAPKPPALAQPSMPLSAPTR